MRNNCSNTTAIINVSRFVRLCSLMLLDMMSQPWAQYCHRYLCENVKSRRAYNIWAETFGTCKSQFKPRKIFVRCKFSPPLEREIWRKPRFREIPSSTDFHNKFFNELRHESTEFRTTIDISSNIVFFSTSVNH